MSTTDNETTKTGGTKPPMYAEAMVGVKVKVPRPFRDVIAEVGDGNLSLGVRRLVAHYTDDVELHPDDQS